MRRQSSRRTGGANGAKLFLKSMAAMAGLLIASIFTTVSPASAQTLYKADEGTLVCIIFHDIRNLDNSPTSTNNKEITWTGVALRNFDPDSTISIDELTIYDRDGDPLMFDGHVLNKGDVVIKSDGKFRLVLEGNQTARFDTIGLFEAKVPPARPSQLVIRWSSDMKGAELFGNVARIKSRRDQSASPKVVQEERSRGLLRCAAVRSSSD